MTLSTEEYYKIALMSIATSAGRGSLSQMAIEALRQGEEMADRNEFPDVCISLAWANPQMFDKLFVFNEDNQVRQIVYEQNAVREIINTPGMGYLGEIYQ